MPPSRRQDLVDAAMRVFYTNGFHSTGLDMILQESGVSRMTLYNHFKSKDELIVAALNRRDEVFKGALLARLESAPNDPRSRLDACFDYHDTWLNSDEFHGCMFINAAAEFQDGSCDARRAVMDHKLGIERILERECERLGAHDPQRLARDLSMLLEGAISQAHLIDRVKGKHSDAARRAKAAADLLISAACAAR